MRNLAGDLDCDTWIVGELALAGIPFERREQQPGEVPTHYIGALTISGIGTVTFRRAWCYWVAEGAIPLAVAERLYAHPIGRQAVWVAGHADAPAPRFPWVSYWADGMQLFPRAAEDEVLALEADYATLSPAMQEIVQTIRRTTRFVDDPAAVAKEANVALYHIDSQEGLALFARMLQEGTLQ